MTSLGNPRESRDLSAVKSQLQAQFSLPKLILIFMLMHKCIQVTLTPKQRFKQVKNMLEQMDGYFLQARYAAQRNRLRRRL